MLNFLKALFGIGENDTRASRSYKGENKELTRDDPAMYREKLNMKVQNTKRPYTRTNNSPNTSNSREMNRHSYLNSTLSSTLYAEGASSNTHSHHSHNNNSSCGHDSSNGGSDSGSSPCD